MKLKSILFILLSAVACHASTTFVYTVKNGSGVPVEKTVTLTPSTFFHIDSSGNIEALTGSSFFGLMPNSVVTGAMLASDAARSNLTGGTGVLDLSGFTLTLNHDLAALEALNSTGFAVRTATDTWAQRQIAVANASLIITNGSGVSGNPTLDLAQATTSLKGGVTLASNSDVTTGTDTAKAVVPSSLANWWTTVKAAANTIAGWTATTFTHTSGTVAADVTFPMATLGSSYAANDWVQIATGATTPQSGSMVSVAVDNGTSNLHTVIQFFINPTAYTGTNGSYSFFTGGFGSAGIGLAVQNTRLRWDGSGIWFLDVQMQTSSGSYTVKARRFGGEALSYATANPSTSGQVVQTQAPPASNSGFTSNAYLTCSGGGNISGTFTGNAGFSPVTLPGPFSSGDWVQVATANAGNTQAAGDTIAINAYSVTANRSSKITCYLAPGGYSNPPMAVMVMGGGGASPVCIDQVRLRSEGGAQWYFDVHIATSYTASDWTFSVQRSGWATIASVQNPTTSGLYQDVVTVPVQGLAVNYCTIGQTFAVGSTSVFTGNITANGTNNTLPNQTAANSTSAMTRGLGDARWVTKAWLIKSANYTAVSGDRIQTDTSAGSFTVTLPASATAGDTVVIEDGTASWATHNLTIGRNGLKINNASSDFTASTANGKVSCVYISASYGWSIK